MATQLVTIKTTPAVHKSLKILAAGRGLKQYEVMEVLLEIMNATDGQVVFELFAKKTGEWVEPQK